MLVATMVTTGAMVLEPWVAQAAPHYEAPPPVQVGYTDSATRNRAYDVVEEQDIPLGAWTDEQNRTHVSRVYATFDISAFAGPRVYGGNRSAEVEYWLF